MSTALEFREVAIRHDRDGPLIVSNVSFSIQSGERVALLGLNGSGKTTLLTAAVGLVPHEGAIWVCGHKLSSASAALVRENVGFVFNAPEDQLLFARVFDDVAFGLTRKGLNPDEVITTTRYVLCELGVSHLENSMLHELSHRQKQRVALAGAIVTQPSLLLLDEPSSGLDPVGKRALSMHLTRIGAAMLIATHDLDFAVGVCDRYLAIDGNGTLSEVEDIGDVKAMWGI
ncbi:MAG: energy-coupling factor ABC transporter ATP-binding protein [Polyangiaceae bacterium]|nr:energy-coupling factor ABC transporter ATP-binding protein [Polyangiaceae bacterium]